MEVGLTCVYSPDPKDRASIKEMAQQLVSIDKAILTELDTPIFAMRARVAPWVKNMVASDVGTQTELIIMGHAWDGTSPVNGDSLLRNYLREGQTAFTRLGGSFAILVWHAREEMVLLVTDRLATKKVYFCQVHDTILLSTELRALVTHPLAPGEVDGEAVEQFLITSHLIDSRSLIKGVRLLEPGTFARISRGGVETSAYWRPRIEPGPDDGLDAWADRLANALRPAVRARCDPSPLLLPLSGGLDSRALAAFLPPNIAAAAQACSFGHGHCYDVRYGRRVAHALGASFQRLSIPQDFYRRYLEPVQTLCDGEVSIEAFPMYRLIDTGMPGQTTLMGFLGDALSGGHLVGPEASMDSPHSLDVIWHKKYQSMGFSQQQLQSVLLPERYEAIRGSTRALMETALAQADAETLDEKALVVELYHRQSRYISYFGRLLSTRLRVELPFLDVAVLDTFLAMPLAYRQGQRAYRRMLARHAPLLAAVAENKTRRPVAYTDKHGLTQPSSGHTKSMQWPSALQWRLNAGKRAWNDLVIKASGGWLGPHDRSYYVHHDENIRRIDPAWFRSMLLDLPVAGEWFQLRALERLFDEHTSRRKDHSIRINNIISFLAWHQRTKKSIRPQP